MLNASGEAAQSRRNRCSNHAVELLNPGRNTQKELARNGVTLKLLWMEYCEECRQLKQQPFMYSQFCYHFQQYAEKERATMHIPRKPGDRIEVDWAGDK